MVVAQARILVVDDDMQMINLIIEVLRLVPCEALVAINGEEALALLQQEMDLGDEGLAFRWRGRVFSRHGNQF